jgi:hypothetical protein
MHNLLNIIALNSKSSFAIVLFGPKPSAQLLSRADCHHDQIPDLNERNRPLTFDSLVSTL